MGKSDYYASGQWNVRCDLCGAKVKSGAAVKTWDNQYVCRHHKERRNPQDFLRGVKDDQSVPWSRPGGPDTFVPTPWNRTAANSIPAAYALSKGVLSVNGPITSTGALALSSLASLALGDSASDMSLPYSFMGIGSGTSPASLADTALGAELSRVRLTPPLQVGQVITATANFPAGSGIGTVSEIGLFQSPAAGLMLCRVLLPLPAQKGPSDTLSVSWAITIS